MCFVPVSNAPNLTTFAAVVLRRVVLLWSVEGCSELTGSASASTAVVPASVLTVVVVFLRERFFRVLVLVVTA